MSLSMKLLAANVVLVVAHKPFGNQSGCTRQTDGQCCSNDPEYPGCGVEAPQCTLSLECFVLRF